MNTTATGRAVLEVLATAEKPVAVNDVLTAVLPPRPSVPRQGGKRDWGMLWEAAVADLSGLRRAGLVHVGAWTACYEITAAGREALAGMKEQT